MRPLLRSLARPMKLEWKMRPYLGVLLFVFSALHPAGCVTQGEACCNCPTLCSCGQQACLTQSSSQIDGVASCTGTACT